MAETARWLAHWVGLTDHLLRRADPEFPCRLLMQELVDAFDTQSAWVTLEAPGGWTSEPFEPPPGWPPSVEELEFWDRVGMPSHPLAIWFATTGDPRAMSLGRVPRRISPAGRSLVVANMTGWGLDQQLVIPIRVSSATQWYLMLAQSGRDYPGDVLERVRQIQPLLCLVARQCSVRPAHPGTSCGARSDAGLTGREEAVLSLLASGLTAAAIGHRLGTSPRTVHKHLERIYRKLDVNDRMLAVQEATDRGLVSVEEATGLRV